MTGWLPYNVLDEATAKEITARVDDDRRKVEYRYGRVGLRDEGHGVEEWLVAGGKHEVIAVGRPGPALDVRLKMRE